MWSSRLGERAEPALPFAFPGITLWWVHSSGVKVERKVLIAPLWLRNAAIKWPNWDLLVGGLAQLQAVYLLQGGGQWGLWLLVTLGLLVLVPGLV